jgi:hypothetical protein
VIFFAILYSFSGADFDGWRPPHLPRLRCNKPYTPVAPGL